MMSKSIIIGIFLVGIIVFGGYKSLSFHDDLQDLNQEYKYILKYLPSAHQNKEKTSQYPPDFQIYDLVIFGSLFSFLLIGLDWYINMQNSCAFIVKVFYNFFRALTFFDYFFGAYW